MINFMTLSEVCTNIVDCPHESPKWLREGIPVIRNFNLVDGQIDLSDDYYVDEETYNKRIRRAIPSEGDIIFSREAPIGNCAIIPSGFKCCLGQRLVLLQVNKEICSPEYLLTVLLSDYVKKQIEQVSRRGSIVSNFNISELGGLSIPIIDNQEKISDIATTISKKIANNKIINKELESMVKTIYDYWFLQFEFPNEEGKPYKSSGGKMVWNDELKREIPEGWKCDILREYISLIKGISYTSKNIESGKGVPMINLASIDINRNYKPNELKFYEGEYNYLKEVHSEDMLIACTDLTRNANIVGSPILVPNMDEKYLYSMDLAKLDLVSEELEPMYLYMTLRTECYHNYIKGFATGTNVMHLNTNGISWFRVCFPPKNIQKKFSLLVKEIHEMKCKLLRENQELTSLRDFLLPILLNGQVGFVR